MRVLLCCCTIRTAQWERAVTLLLPTEESALVSQKSFSLLPSMWSTVCCWLLERNSVSCNVILCAMFNAQHLQCALCSLWHWWWSRVLSVAQCRRFLEKPWKCQKQDLSIRFHFPFSHPSHHFQLLKNNFSHSKIYWKRDNSLSPFEVENVENVEGGLVDQCLG